MPRNRNRVILVTGATGHQGGAVWRKLRERDFPVRALTRDPDQAKARDLAGHGTEVVRGDLDDRVTLTRALDGAYGVFSVQSPAEHGVAAEVRQGITLADTAKRSRIGHFVYSSVASAYQNTGIPHFDSKFRIEQHLRGTGMRFTIFRPVFFMENWLGMRPQIEQGTLPLPLKPEARLQMVAVDDIGAFVAMAFENPDRWQGQAREIAGDELSMSELAGRFSRTMGREVAYRQVPWDEWERQAGREMTIMWRWFEAAGYHVDIPQLRQDYPQLTGFDRWIAQKWTLRRTA